MLTHLYALTLTSIKRKSGAFVNSRVIFTLNCTYSRSNMIPKWFDNSIEFQKNVSIQTKIQTIFTWWYRVSSYQGILKLYKKNETLKDSKVLKSMLRCNISVCKKFDLDEFLIWKQDFNP